MKRFLLLIPAFAVVGCSGEPAPVVGDNPVSSGIQARPPAARKFSSAAATQPRRLRPQDYRAIKP